MFSRLLTFAPIITEESILLTIPVAFIYINLLVLQFCTISICSLMDFIPKNPLIKLTVLTDYLNENIYKSSIFILTYLKFSVRILDVKL